jgi:ATP-binding cassette subfamily B multidrug efflux pump
MYAFSMNNRHLSLWTNFIKQHRFFYLLGVGTIVLTGITQVLSTRLTGWIIDFFQDEAKSVPSVFLPFENKEDNFIVLFFVLVASRVFLTIGRYGWRMTLARKTHVASSFLKRQLWQNARWFKQKDLQEKFTKGVLMNASTSDVGAARFIYGFTIVGFLDVIFLGTLSLVAMCAISVKLTLCVLSVLILIPFLVKRLSRLEIERYTLSQERLGKFNDLVTQCVSSVRLQRLTQTGRFWIKKLMEDAREYRSVRLKAIFTSLQYYPVMGWVSVLSYVVLFILGMNFVFDGSISVGDFVAMQGLILLIQDPLLELGYVISDWKKSTTSLKRLHDVFTHDKEDYLMFSKDVERSVEQSEYAFDVQDLTFIYPKTMTEDGEEPSINTKPKELFQKFSCQIEHGKRFGITGAIGTGKTTFIKILAGLERGHGGVVKFHGKEFNDYEHQTIRKSIAIVPQRPFLFASTIKENIQMGRSLSEEEIWKYLNLAGLDKDVEGFKEKLDTPLGEWGINLSGGQKQRLTLARALSVESDHLILDDCLSAVDTVTEEKILENLDRHLKDKTIIWVAHRQSTLKKCDEIIDFNKFMTEQSEANHQEHNVDQRGERNE